ncbi:STAS domain-containing protein [Occultella aeris]|uniref:STAS domain protein n=1 Tax=Occultella aeris TaxID=2761496 RepID=A0A7M4DHB5_9MICO|nr:STAS domain-containing protein [Occultella aeris]VZO36308.1 STAS domain protein [Occultella aeris]
MPGPTAVGRLNMRVTKTATSLARERDGRSGVIDVSTSAAEVLVTVTGDLDLSASEVAQSALRQISHLQHDRLVLDVCDMGFMDSSGASWLITLADEIGRRGGTVVLRGASARDMFVLKVTGALDLFEIDETHRC